jgi:hypothetical protein
MNRGRRVILGGAGVAVALPALESLVPRAARAQTTAARRQRLFTVFLPNGALMEEWIPTSQGADFALPPLMEPLAPFRKKLLVLSGLTNLPGKPDNGTGDHACGTAAAFTASPPQRGDGALIRNGVSVDQAAAARLRQDTRLASLQLGLEDGATSGDCEFGFSCVYENAISWASERQALPKTTSPAAVFDQMFDGFDPAASEQARAARRARKTSVLDYVRGEAAALSARLGRSDRLKLDQVLSGVRDLEKQIQRDAAGPTAGCAPPARPPEEAADPTALSRLMNALIATAFRCDITRVVSYMLGHAFPSRAYSFIGVNQKHHDASHYFDDAAKQDYRKIILWHMGVVADLLGRLEAIPDGPGGSVLDSTLMVLTSDCGESRGHDHTDLPVLLAGGAGALKMGRHLAHGGQQTVGNLYVSVLQALGVAATSFGADGKNPLPGLT